MNKVYTNLLVKSEEIIVDSKTIEQIKKIRNIVFNMPLNCQYIVKLMIILNNLLGVVNPTRLLHF